LSAAETNITGNTRKKKLANVHINMTSPQCGFDEITNIRETAANETYAANPKYRAKKKKQKHPASPLPPLASLRYSTGVS
jgi:hypothetical protein